MRGCCTKEEVNVESVFEKRRLLTRLLQPRSRLRNIINMQIMSVSYTSVIHGYINQVFIAHFSFSSRWEWPQVAAPALYTGQWYHHTRKRLRTDFTIHDHGHHENKFQEPTAKTIVHFARSKSWFSVRTSDRVYYSVLAPMPPKARAQHAMAYICVRSLSVMRHK